MKVEEEWDSMSSRNWDKWGKGRRKRWGEKEEENEEE